MTLHSLCDHVVHVELLSTDPQISRAALEPGPSDPGRTPAEEPSLGYHFAMRPDAADRVLSERIVTPDHLLIRRYSYPS